MIAVLTTTLTSTTTVFTSTTTITASGRTLASVITETGVIIGSSTLVAKSTSVPSAQPTAATPYLGPALQSAVLNSTNYYRAQHQADPLVWDEDLAAYAQNYARQCVWQHSGGALGENLAESYDHPALAIDAWANEERHYDYAKAKFSESTGHYSQLVWKDTSSVGCGAVQCNNTAAGGVKGWYLVCEYDPAGNVPGRFRHEVSKAGESVDGQLGFGAASSVGYGMWKVATLVVGWFMFAMSL